MGIRPQLFLSQKITTPIFLKTGSLNLDKDIILTFGKDDYFQSTRDTIINLLGKQPIVFIYNNPTLSRGGSSRFKKRGSQPRVKRGGFQLYAPIQMH